MNITYGELAGTLNDQPGEFYIWETASEIDAEMVWQREHFAQCLEETFKPNNLCKTFKAKEISRQPIFHGLTYHA